MTDRLVLRFLLLMLLIACCAILTMAEAAYFSLGRARLKRVSEPGADRHTHPLIERPHDLLVTLLVGATFISIGASAVAASFAEDLFGARYGLLIESVGMILILTTFGEVLPMTVAVKYPERVLALVRRPVAWLEAVLLPVRAVLSALTTATMRASSN